MIDDTYAKYGITTETKKIETFTVLPLPTLNIPGIDVTVTKKEEIDTEMVSIDENKEEVKVEEVNIVDDNTPPAIKASDYRVSSGIYSALPSVFEDPLYRNRIDPDPLIPLIGDNDIDEKYVLIEAINYYIHKEFLFEKLFKNSGPIKVYGNHPFSLASTADVPSGIFPAISVSLHSEHTAIDTLSKMDSVGNRIDAEDVDILKNKPHSLISEEHIDQLEKLTEDKTAVTCVRNQVHTEKTFVIDIWAASSVVKDALYDMVKISIFKWFKDIKSSENYYLDSIQNVSLMHGCKDGMYNFDLGYPLYGAQLTIKLQSPFFIYTVYKNKEIQE